MTSSDNNRFRFRPATMSSCVAGAGSALFGIVFAAFVIYMQFRSGFDLPQILVGLVGTGLLLLLGVWVLVRPSRLNLILDGVLLLLYGGFILSAVLFSSSQQPFWVVPVGLALIGLSVVSFKDAIAPPSLSLAPASATPTGTPPPAAVKPWRVAWAVVLVLSLAVAASVFLAVDDAFRIARERDRWLQQFQREHSGMSGMITRTTHGRHGTITVRYEAQSNGLIDTRDSVQSLRDFWTLTDKKYVVLAGLGFVGIIGIFVFRTVSSRKRRHGSTLQHGA